MNFGGSSLSDATEDWLPQAATRLIESVISRLPERSAPLDIASSIEPDSARARVSSIPLCSPALAEAISRGTGRLEAQVLARPYLHLSSLVGTS